MQSAFNLSLTNNYTDGGNVTVRMTQMAPVYPGSSIKPAILDGQNADYYWAPVRITSGQISFANRPACPSGWRYPTRSEWVDVMWKEPGGDGVQVGYANSTAANNGKLLEYTYYWSSEAYYYLSVRSDKFWIGNVGASDTNYCRCIQKK